MDDKPTSLPKVATTFNDKYLILQARDKYVRSQRVKQTDLKTAKVIAGTCTDMCPEYERYCRINRNCVSALEKTNDQPDEFKMVKEYVRSGADQEEPLSYELRPPPVLDRTMLYLTTNIIDLIDNEDEEDDEQQTLVGTWYNFLWNRLRAIRKDITQQDLNGVSSVHLMECCVRFHIYSAHRLVEEDTSIYDQKINDDGLRKSLQSLKDFYYDLSLKGVECNNESEFRCYDIILNLRENDTIREISHFRKSVRQSEEVQFAIKVHTAYNDNNYVRFFDLLKEATYLNACVMHRHFNAIRFRSIYVLRRALGVKDQKVQIPIENLFYQLCFQDENEFEEFCGSLKLEMDADNVILSKWNSGDELPKVENLLNKRSLEYVENKKDKKLSEIIYGEAIGENPYKKHQLQNSFDDNNRLIETKIKLDDKLIKIDENIVGEFALKNAQAKAPSSTTVTSSTMISKPAEPSTINKFSSRDPRLSSENATAKNLFGQTSNIFGNKISNNLMTNNELFGKSSSPSTFSSTNQPLFGNLTKESSPSTNLFSGFPSGNNLFSKAPVQDNNQKTNESFHFKALTNIQFDNATAPKSNLFNDLMQSQGQPTSSLFKLPQSSDQADKERQANELKRIKEEEEAAERKRLNEEDLQSVIASVFQTLLDEVLNNQIKKSALDVFIGQVSIGYTNQFLTEAVLELINNLATYAYRNEQLRINRLKEITSSISNELSKQYLSEELDRQTRSVARQVYLEELDKYLTCKSEVFASAYFKETIDELVYEICSRTYETDLCEHQRIVNFIKQKRGWRLAGNYFRYWKGRCDYLKRFRFIRDNFPASKMESSPPVLKRVLSVPDLLDFEQNKRRQLINHNGINQQQPNHSLQSKFDEESRIKEELKELDERLKRKEKHDELSRKSKIEYARKSLDNLKKINKTFSSSLNLVHSFLSSDSDK